MNFGFDLDGVYADFVSSLLALVTKQTGRPMPKQSASYPSEWNFHRIDGKLSKLEETNLWDYVKDSDFWETLEPYPEESIEALNTLDLPENNVYFITSRPGNRAKALTERWLWKQGFHSPRVIIADQKGPEARALALDFFIDDKPENTLDVVRDAAASVYLYDRPWNRTFDNEREAILRVSSVAQALDHFYENERHPIRVAA